MRNGFEQTRAPDPFSITAARSDLGGVGAFGPAVPGYNHAASHPSPAGTKVQSTWVGGGMVGMGASGAPAAPATSATPKPEVNRFLPQSGGGSSTVLPTGRETVPTFGGERGSVKASYTPPKPSDSEGVTLLTSVAEMQAKNLDTMLAAAGWPLLEPLLPGIAAAGKTPIERGALLAAQGAVASCIAALAANKTSGQLAQSLWLPRWALATDRALLGARLCQVIPKVAAWCKTVTDPSYKGGADLAIPPATKQAIAAVFKGDLEAQLGKITAWANDVAALNGQIEKARTVAAQGALKSGWGPTRAACYPEQFDHKATAWISISPGMAREPTAVGVRQYHEQNALQNPALYKAAFAFSGTYYGLQDFANNAADGTFTPAYIVGWVKDYERDIRAKVTPLLLQRGKVVKDLIEAVTLLFGLYPPQTVLRPNTLGQPSGPQGAPAGWVLWPTSFGGQNAVVAAQVGAYWMALDPSQVAAAQASGFKDVVALTEADFDAIKNGKKAFPYSGPQSVVGGLEAAYLDAVKAAMLGTPLPPWYDSLPAPVKQFCDVQAQYKAAADFASAVGGAVGNFIGTPPVVDQIYQDVQQLYGPLPGSTADELKASLEKVQAATQPSYSPDATPFARLLWSRNLVDAVAKAPLTASSPVAYRDMVALAQAMRGTLEPLFGVVNAHSAVVVDQAVLRVKELGEAQALLKAAAEDLAKSSIITIDYQAPDGKTATGKMAASMTVQPSPTDADKALLAAALAAAQQFEAKSIEMLKAAEDAAKAVDDAGKAGGVAESKVVPPAPAEATAIAVSGDVAAAGATVTIDGAAVGNLPCTVAILPGAHKVVASKDGQSAEQTVTVELHKTATVEFVFAKAEGSSGALWLAAAAIAAKLLAG